MKFCRVIKNELPERPPKRWFDEKSKEIKKSLKDAHPDWSDKQSDEKTRQTVGDVWYNKLSPSEKEKITRNYESELIALKEYDEYKTMCDGMEKHYSEQRAIDENLLKIARDGMNEVDAPPPQDREVPIHDGMNRLDKDANNLPHPPEAPHEDIEQKMREELLASNKSSNFVAVPAFKVPYVATPKFEGKDSPIIIKAVVLEEGSNINRWRVVPEEFEKVAAQYKAGRHLRVNHGKDVQDVIGKSFDGKVILGKDLNTYLGKQLDGISEEGKYVIAEFEANPQDQQIRTNILEGYVETGSIGLDASAFCETCDKPLVMKEDRFDRTCKHFDAPTKLRNVEVKEYSYVAEPAFEHTKAFPSFSAAVSTILENSSLTYKPQEAVLEMTDTKVESKIEATAKKAEADGEANALAKAYAESEYKRGVAEGQLAAYKEAKKADDDEEEEEKKTAKKASVEAGKTDQVAQVAPTATSSEPTLMEKIMNPVKNMDPTVKALFKAAVEHPSTPNDIRNKYRGRFD